MIKWFVSAAMPLFLFSGCGDLEQEMQDTRTVILKMDFDQRSSSRTSSVSAAELRNYKTHLIMAQPSSEYLSSSYLYPKSLAEGLMDPVSRKITLEIPLNTQMKIFAFLFKENYSHYQLFSAKRDVGYYGESQPFSIGTNTNSLSLRITLKAVSGNGGGSTGDGGGGEDHGDGDNGGSGDYGGTDTTAPTVTFSPVNGATGVAISDNIIITFSEAVRNIDNTELTDSNIDSLITLKLTNASGADIAFDATIDTNKKVITINPTNNLPNSQAVYVAIGATVEDSAGNPITAANATFTTVPDTTAPTVSSIYPADNQSSVSITDNITVTFSEAMDSTYVTTNTDNTSCSGTLRLSSDNFSSCVRMSSSPESSNDNKTFTLDPYDNLTVGTTYKTRVKKRVKDTAGNAMSSRYDTSSGFTPADLTAPTVYLVTTTADNQSSVSITDNITVTFSEAMEPSYVTTNTSDTYCSGSIQVSSANFSSGSCVRMSSDPASSNSNMTFTLDPVDNLTVGTTYKTRVKTGVKDTAGNALSSQYETSSGFTPADLIAPTVSSISPTDNQSSVSVSDNISLTFSEIMDNSSITTNTDNTSCYGSFQVSSDNFSTCVQMSSSPYISNSAKTFTFDPSDNLSYDNKYNIKLTTDTKDENGVSLESPYETSFNTFDNSLVAYYPFNGNVKDLTSNGRDFTVYVDLSPGNATLTTGKDNSSNSAYSFDGDEDYLEYTASIPSFDNYTISLWAKPASSGTYEAMFSSYDDAGKGFQIDLNGGDFHIRKSEGGSMVLSTAVLGVWTFVAFTYDGTNSIGYINDVIPVSQSGGTNDFNRFRIGRNRNGSVFFSGAIDELRIYNRALTASEISSRFAN